MATVRILHVSDLHISKYFRFAKPAGFSPGTLFDTVRNITYAAGHSNGVLSSLVRLIDQLKSSLDAVVITGDIGTTGRIFDLELALEFVAGKTGDNGILSVDGLPTISGLGVPIYLLPGNHDRYVTYYKVLGYNPGGTVFHRVFSEHWSSDVNTHRIVRGSLSVGIITADFSLRQVVDCEEPRIKNKYAQGRVYPDISKTTSLKNTAPSF